MYKGCMKCTGVKNEMKLFSEIYSTYYQITEKILKKRWITKAEILDIIRKNGFSETVLFLEPKLIGEDHHGLLKESDGTYQSILKKEPHIPLTLLEKRWLCAVLHDKKSNLFLDKEQKKQLCNLLGAEPLYQNQFMYFFDRFSDGDDYENEEYIGHFRNILRSVHNHMLIKISFHTRKGDRVTHYFLPVKMEYSSKNDRFRVHVIQYRKDKAVDTGIINLSQITLTECTNIAPATNCIAMYEKREVVIKITEERNAVNRFMMEFAELERVSEYNEETKECLVRVKYNFKDETEILIRLLSFGPVVEVLEPLYFRKKMKERIDKQFLFMK